MAKTIKGQEQEGEISVTMVKFSMKGSDASLQKGLDTIKAAMVQAGFVPAAFEPRQLRSNAPPAQSSESGSSDEDFAEDVVEIEANEETSTTPRKAGAPRKAKATNYKVLQELEFEDVSPTLPEFVAEKDPQSDWDKYKCIAYWFKHHKGMPEITVEHFYTAYLLLGWKTPPNPYQPIADMRKSNRQWFSKGEEPRTYTINNVGERQVRELKKGSD
jgi:hypothetical protein